MLLHLLRQDNRVVAVKRLMGDKTEGEREFLAEMETLGKVKHANIVQLLGYCTFGSDRVLVYEYKCNGNLDLWLHRNALICAGRTGLNWSTRLKIAQVCVLSSSHSKSAGVDLVFYAILLESYQIQVSYLF